MRLSGGLRKEWSVTSRRAWPEGGSPLSVSVSRLQKTRGTRLKLKWQPRPVISILGKRSAGNIRPRAEAESSELRKLSRRRETNNKEMRRWLTQRPRASLSGESRSWRRCMTTEPTIDDYGVPDHLDLDLRRQLRQLDLASEPKLKDDESFEARSYLRAFLRESSYLADSVARQRIRRLIRGSFRGHERKLKDSWRQHDVLLEERVEKWYKDARRKLSVLRRSNEGDPNCLKRVLLEAYGRTGKRRRELLRPLLLSSTLRPLLLPSIREQSSEIAADQGHQEDTRSSDGPSAGTDEMADDTEAGESDEPFHVDSQNQPNTKFEPRPLPPQLAALLRSQIKSAPPVITRINPRRLEADVPELNTWLRPMPQKRLKNLHHNHYAELLSRALPPLPGDEWERLRGIASGEVKIEASKRRRSQSPSAGGPSGLKPTALDIVAQYGKVPQKSTLASRGGWSQRTLRRLYVKVFSQCPIMHFDEHKKEWRVTWGEQALLDASRNAKK